MKHSCWWLLILLPGIVHADWWLYGGLSNYASDPLRESGSYAGASVLESYEKLDVEAGMSLSTLAYKPEAVQNTTTVSNLRLAVAPGFASITDAVRDSGVSVLAARAPGFSGGLSGSGGQTGGGLRNITVSSLTQFDLTLALGRTLGPHYVRGGLHWTSANETAIDGSYSGFLDWQYTRPHVYFVRLGLATGERLGGDVQASQYEVTAGSEFGNPVISGLWQVQLNYLVGINDWSGVGSYTADSVEAAAAWSKASWRLDASVWTGERMYALLNRGYYLISQQDLLKGGYLLGATYRMEQGSLHLFYSFTRLDPDAQNTSELSTIGIQYQRGFM